MQGEWFPGEEHRTFELPGDRGGSLLLHGFMGTPSEMRPLARELNMAGFSAYAPLLPGFGEQIGSLGEVGRKEWVNAAARRWTAMHRRGQGDILIGFSMGGALALHLANAFPPRRLILLAPLWKVMGGDWRLRLLPVLKHFIREVRPFARADLTDPNVRKFFTGLNPDIDVHDPEVEEMIRSEIALPTRTLDELRLLALESGTLARRVTVPTLVIQGTNDVSVHAADTRRLVSKMGTNVRLVEMSAEHMVVSNEYPSWKQVRELVLDFATGATE
jgi:carboxylesterase